MKGPNPAPSTTTRKDGRSPASFLEGSSWTRTSFGCCRGNGEQEGTAEGGSATLQGDEALVSAGFKEWSLGPPSASRSPSCPGAGANARARQGWQAPAAATA